MTTYLPNMNITVCMLSIPLVVTRHIYFSYNISQSMRLVPHAQIQDIHKVRKAPVIADTSTVSETRVSHLVLHL